MYKILKMKESRFQELVDFLNYLEEWKEEVRTRPNVFLSMSIVREAGNEALEGGDRFHAIMKEGYR